MHTVPRLVTLCGDKHGDNQRKEATPKETRPWTDATKNTGLLEERVRKRRRDGSNNATDVVGDRRGGGMATLSCVVRGGDGDSGKDWHQNGLVDGVCVV
jgi:hypothetical protein